MSASTLSTVEILYKSPWCFISVTEKHKVKTSRGLFTLAWSSIYRISSSSAQRETGYISKRKDFTRNLVLVGEAHYIIQTHNISLFLQMCTKANFAVVANLHLFPNSIFFACFHVYFPAANLASLRGRSLASLSRSKSRG